MNKKALDEGQCYFFSKKEEKKIISLNLFDKQEETNDKENFNSIKQKP
jgi:hypothetical protein